jgi:hypothetical protein
MKTAIEGNQPSYDDNNPFVLLTYPHHANGTEIGLKFDVVISPNKYEVRKKVLWELIGKDQTYRGNFEDDVGYSYSIQIPLSLSSQHGDYFKVRVGFDSNGDGQLSESEYAEESYDNKQSLMDNTIDPLVVNVENTVVDDEGLLRYQYYNPFSQTHNFGMIVISKNVYDSKRAWLVDKITTQYGLGAAILPHAVDSLKIFTKHSDPFFASLNPEDRFISVTYPSLTSRVGGAFDFTGAQIKQQHFDYSELTSETHFTELTVIKNKINSLLVVHRDSIDSHFLNSTGPYSIPEIDSFIDFYVNGMAPEDPINILSDGIGSQNYDMYLTFGGATFRMKVEVLKNYGNQFKFDLKVEGEINDLIDYNYFRGRVFSQFGAINSIGLNSDIENYSGEIFYLKLQFNEENIEYMP